MGKLLNVLQMFTGSKKKRKTPISQITRHLPSKLFTYQLISDSGETESQRQPVILSLHSFVCTASPFWPFLYPLVPPAPAQKVVPFVKKSTTHFVIHIHTLYHLITMWGNFGFFHHHTILYMSPTASQILHQALPEIILQGQRGKA